MGASAPSGAASRIALAHQPASRRAAPRQTGSGVALDKETHTMSYAVTNPATGETVKTYDTITNAELEAAIAAADEAHRTWSKSTTVEERAALIRRVSELHTERRQELAELIVREMGKPIKQA